MSNIINKDNIILYHSSQNIIKNGYMTWYTDNIDYYNNLDIYNIIKKISYIRCYGDKYCSTLNKKINDKINIQIFNANNLKLIKLSETNINLIELIFSEQTIIDYLRYNKIDGFYSTFSYNINSNVYYLFTNKNLKSLGKIKHVIYPKKKLNFIKKFIFNIKHIIVPILELIKTIYYIIIILLFKYKNNKLRKIKYLNNNIYEKIPNNPYILCWNIHYFRDVYFKYTFNDIIKYIKKINPTILCLQEVYNIPIINYKYIIKYLKNIGYKYILNDNLTGLLFASKNIPFKGELIKFSKYRGYLKIEYKNSIIINTHLDVSNEDIRVKQINIIINDIKNTNKKIILCGDLNTIVKSDYSKEEWNNKLINIRNYMFEPHVVNILKNNNFIDNGYLYNKNKINTSLYDRRVDYIFTKNYYSKYYYVDINNKLSDHYPILFK